MHSNKGFTYIEVITTLVILGILATAGALGMTQMAEGYHLAKEQTQVLQQAQLTLARITSDISHFDEDSLQNDSTTTSLHYTLEYLETSGTTSNENYTLLLNGSTLVLRDNSANPVVNHVLADGVSAFTVTYYQGDGTTVVVDIVNGANLVQVMELSITMNDSIGTTFTTRVAPIR